MFTTSLVNILCSNVKKYISNILLHFKINQAVVNSTIATDGNVKGKKVQNIKSLTPFLPFLVVIEHRQLTVH